MIPVYKSGFSSVKYDPQNNLLEQVWLPDSEKLNDEEFMKELTVVTEAIYYRKVEKLLVDQRNFFYVVPDAIQEQIDREVNLQLFQKGIRKMAFVVSPDIFSQLSTMQTFEKENSAQINVKFFDDYQKAYQWLLQ